MVLQTNGVISEDEIREALCHTLSCVDKPLRKVLLLPPDYTRMYSGAGTITKILYQLLSPNCQIDVMPALGTHVPMSQQECNDFFEGVVPYEKLIVHHWRDDVIKIGEVPAVFVSEVSEGLVCEAINVEVNKLLLDPSYDLIVSIGQVVPHEVVGMANYSKNIFVGCGGASMINASHMLGAFYGMERIMGKDFSPVRRVFDYAQEHFLQDLPLLYILTCTTNTQGRTNLHGLYIGNNRSIFEQAVAQSQKTNIIHLEQPLQTCVVYLDPREFKSTWLGNKAIYRTRMAIADGGELIILAPGIERFGEDPEVDRLIRKYGYVGRQRILELVKTEPELRANLSVAAHLIHGSSDGRFRITYCTKALTEKQVRSVGFSYLPYDTAQARYPLRSCKDGFCKIADQTVFYISNPALGLWDADLNQ